ncbi:high affinity immunoglobulin gamma Fc receptor I-like [Aplochiton taeniatus]
MLKNGEFVWLNWIDTKKVSLVRKGLPECAREWGKAGGSTCTLTDVFHTDSGVYWCESDSGQHSDAVNITVIERAVILKSPVLPVTEGEAVTLRCRNKTTPSNLTTDFYKDGSLIRTESTGEMTIPAVSKSDEGLYKCHNSDLGESPESWLAVRAGAVILESPVLPVTEGEAVTLHCRYQTTPFNLTTDFYKDGSLIRTESTGEMTIPAVSKSDEGLYKCHNSDLGESPQSWLAVRTPSPAPIMSLPRLICHLVVASPYLLTSIILGVKYHRREQGRNQNTHHSF